MNLLHSLVIGLVNRNLSHSERFAVKFHERERVNRRELGVYFRSSDLGVETVSGYAVPQLIHFDDELLAIEMTIVSPPFCLDFGGAYLNRPPDYSAEVWEDWREMKSEAFEDNWPKVESILAEFRSFGALGTSTFGLLWPAMRADPFRTCLERERSYRRRTTATQANQHCS